jgi:Tol biopolymer transport system component
MVNRLSAGCIFLVSAALLCGCGSEATPVEEATAASDTSPASTAARAATSTATEVVGPAVTPTLEPMDPMPGLVYAAPVPEKGIVGPFLVESDGRSTQLGDKPNPALSPDRSQVLYSDKDDIWILDLETEKTRNLTKTNDRIETFYQWWPANPDLIVFQYQPMDDAGPDAGFLTSMKPDGTNVLLLDEEARSFSPAALSPDGQSIAYDRAGQPWIYHFNAGKMPIFPKSFTGFHIAVNPAWSPDSRQIAWQLFGIPTAEDSNSAVAVLDLDTFTVNRIHEYPVDGGSGIGPHHLAWSPDGKWLAVANPGESDKVSLWAMLPDGSEEHYIGSGDLPIWSPDGSMLVYSVSGSVFAVKTGEWIPAQVKLPESAQVIDWVKLD